MTCAKPQLDPRGSKKLLRKRLLKARGALQKVEVEANSATICDRLSASKCYTSASHIGIYAAIGNEVDLISLARAVWDSDRSLYLPVIDQPRDGHLMFGLWSREDQLLTNRWGIAEPGEPWVDAATLDLLAVPIVGFDRAGNRIGMGGGYYDRTLSAMRQAAGRSNAQLPVTVGVAHEIQRVASLEPDSWDQPLDAVITEQSWQTPSTLPHH